jgi:hypothetical protein
MALSILFVQHFQVGCGVGERDIVTSYGLPLSYWHTQRKKPDSPSVVARDYLVDCDLQFSPLDV